MVACNKINRNYSQRAFKLKHKSINSFYTQIKLQITNLCTSHFRKASRCDIACIIHSFRNLNHIVSVSWILNKSHGPTSPTLAKFRYICYARSTVHYAGPLRYNYILAPSNKLYEYVHTYSARSEAVEYHCQAFKFSCKRAYCFNETADIFVLIENKNVIFLELICLKSHI